MKMNIPSFFEDAGIQEKVYPGKRIVKQCHQPGEYKSHSVVVDWRNPALLSISVKAGQSGKDLPVELLKKYPVSFQTPTYVHIGTTDEDLAGEDRKEEEEDEEEEGKSASGKGGGGAKKPKKKPAMEQEGLAAMSDAFSKVIEGNIPELGKIREMVVMGMQISERAYDRVLDVLTHQIEKGKIAATDLLAEAGKFITKYTPPSFMKPTGDEDAVYEYNREKVEPMFGAAGPR